MNSFTLYRQGGKLGLYQLIMPMIAMGPHMRRTFSASYGEMWVYFKGEMADILFREQGMEEVAKAFAKHTASGFPREWQEKWEKIGRELEASSRAISHLELGRLSIEELWKLYEEHMEKHFTMWGISIFIDGLDSGYDQREIERVRLEHGFTQDETQTLLAPLTQAYVTDLEQAFYEVKLGRRSVSEFKEEFFWCRTDYAGFAEVDEEFVKAAAAEAHEAHFVSPQAEQEAVLRAHNLTINPFAVFQILAVWRDERKRLNGVGLYGASRLIVEGLRRQGIAARCLNELLPGEAREVFFGTLNQAHLEERLQAGVLVHGLGDGTYDTLEGAAALPVYQELLTHLPKMETHELRGMVACRGRKVGTVRVVPSADGPEARAFQFGEILVTSMTRPEFMPLMKKAGAIVTNEGGISCHAAIVSRELNIPCIIGTKIATQILKDGDRVEVDAEAGIVRKVL